MDEQEKALCRRTVGNRLRHLRTSISPRMDQGDAAKYIGLGESSGYRTMGKWENGEVAPSSKFCSGVRRYLWCALGLHARPNEFDELWETIQIAWDWPSLSELDRAELRSLTCADDRAEPAHALTQPTDPPAAIPADQSSIAETMPEPALTSVSAQQDMSTAMTTSPAAPDPAAHQPALVAQQQWTWLLRAQTAVGLVVLLALAILAIAANSIFGRDRSPDAAAPANLDFESPGDLAPWSIVGDPTCATRVENASAAHTRQAFLRFDPRAGDCTSVRYDLSLTNLATHDTTAGFAIWARSANTEVAQIELALWAGQHTSGEPAMTQKQSLSFEVDSDHWRCLDVTLPLDAPSLNLVRAEVYAKGDPPAPFDLDHASIHFEGQSNCLGQSVRLTNPNFERGSSRLGWSFLQPDQCVWRLVDEPAASHDGRRWLRVERRNAKCASLYQDVNTTPLAGVAYRSRIWVRAASADPVTVSWVLWALGKQSISARQRIVADNNQWRCVETALTPSGDGFERLRSELYFDSPGAIVAVDDAQLAVGDQPLCPPQESLLNAGFENEATVAPWSELNKCIVPADDGDPHSGQRFVRTQKSGDDCISLFQDVYRTASQEDGATLSVWLRAAGATPARGQLALRANGDTTELAEMPFTLQDRTWTCLEVSLQPQTQSYESWRAEIYFSSEGALYDLDDATLTFGERGACPQVNYALRRLELLPGSVAYSGSGVSGFIEVENMADVATDWPHPVRYWLAATRTGPPLFDEASGSTLAPKLAAHEDSGALYFDLALPPALEADKTYFLIADVGATPLDSKGSGMARRVLPIRLEPCIEGAFFCDMPTGFWAEVEATAWYTAGVTSGCRSETQPYRDLPFCPQQMLSPDTMAIFLLRHLISPTFKPTQPYQGIYSDVPESHRRSLWIEAFHDNVGIIERSNCPQEGDQPRFCPTAPLLRGDLPRILGAALGLDPAAVENPHFVDLEEDASLAALAEALWRAGILPDPDPNCPDHGLGAQFCPDEPARRIDAAVWMARAFGLVVVKGE